VPISLRITLPEGGPSRVVVPVAFVVMGIGIMVWFHLEGPYVGGWQRYLPYVMGGVFALVGMVRLVAELRRGGARDAARRALEEHRDAPWRVRPEWRKDELVASTPLDRSLVILALAWNLFSWPLAFLIIGGEQGSGDRAVWLVALFPVIGLGMLARLAYELMRARKFGDTMVRLDPMPPRLGRRFEGLLRAKVGREARPEDGFLVRVSCYRQEVRYTRDSDGDRRRQIERDLLWRDETRLRDRSVLYGTSVEVPFTFDLPEDAPASTALKLDNRILWEVAAEAEIPAIDFAARVEVPVFPAEPGSVPAKASASGTPDTVAETAFGRGGSGAVPAWSFEEPLTKGIELVDEPDLFELHFTAARKRKGAIVLGVLGVVLLAGAVPALLTSVLLGLILLLMGAVLVYGGIQQGTNDTVLRVADGRIQVRHDGIGMPEDIDVPVGQMEEVMVHLGTDSASDDATYSISLVARPGEGLEHLQKQAANVMKVMSRFGVTEAHPAMEAMREGAERPRILVSDQLSDKDEADWLASRIREAVERAGRRPR